LKLTHTEEHRWAEESRKRISQETGGVGWIPNNVIITITCLFNSSTTGKQFYDWMNANYTPFQINTYGMFLVTHIPYWITGLIFMAFDLVPVLNQVLTPLKIQPSKHVEWKDYHILLPVTLRNHLVVVLPLFAATAVVFPCDTSTVGLPGPLRTVATFFICLICEEIGFYYVHRWFQSPALYTKINKMHHEYTAPVSLSAQYCTLIEHLFVSSPSPHR
jgi:methylsterol monooxygenase